MARGGNATNVADEGDEGGDQADARDRTQIVDDVHVAGPGRGAAEPTVERRDRHGLDLFVARASSRHLASEGSALLPVA